MTRRVLTFLGCLSAWLACDGIPAGAAAPRTAVPAGTAIASQAALDHGELFLLVSNGGSLAFPPPVSIGTDTPPPGFEWPRGSGRSPLFAAGLWIGARVNGETRVTVAEYGSEYSAGPMNDAGQAVDPGMTDPAHRVYKIRRGDGPGNPDWAQWPIALGAPSDGAGNPRVIGDQTLWSVYNDAVASRHTLQPGGTAPLGLEIRQTAFGFDRPGPIGRIAFVEYEILNRGGNHLEDAYVGLWADPDLGDAHDDLVGCDTTLSLGFAYNADDDDGDYGVYGAHPPALGIQIVKGPRANGIDLPMTSFGRLLKNYLEPDSALESYARFQGIREDGSVQGCPLDGAGPLVTPLFEVAGDPVVDPDGSPEDVALSCLDSRPADRRMLVATGPFDFPAGSSRRIVIAILVGGRPDLGDRLGNIERLRMTARVARAMYTRDFDDIGTAPELDPGDRYLATAGEFVTLDGSRSVAGSGIPPTYHWEFGDGGVPGPGLVKAHVYTRGGNFKPVLYAVGGDFPGYCGARVEVFNPALIPVAQADAATLGLVEVSALDGPGLRNVFEGVPSGDRRLNQGLDTGCRWSGSTLAGNPADAAFCPAATLAPEEFRTVRLVYGAPQRAYRYFRRELPGGGEPAAGRGYIYQGFVDVPFRALKELGNGQLLQLDLMFTERQVTDDAGDPTGLAQPPSQDGIWLPTNEADGGHEYISVVARAYSGSTDPAYEQDGAFFSGNLPILYGGRVRRRNADALQSGEGLAFRWVDMADPGPGLDAAWGTTTFGAPTLFLANGDGTSRPFVYQSFAGVFKDYKFALPLQVGPATAAAWGDCNGDGLDDLFLSSPAGSSLLQAYDPDVGLSGFIVAPVPAALAVASAQSAWADMDLDGDLDLGVSDLYGRVRLWRNDGGASFTDVTPLTDVEGQGPPGTRVRWVDFDGDLDPDLCLTHEVGGVLLLRNDAGAARWVELPALSTRGARDAAWGDYDGDGDLDVYVVHAGDDHALLRNQGSGAFDDVTTAALYGDGQGRRAAWTDFDLDGDLDLAVADAGTGLVIVRNDDGAWAPEPASPSWPATVNAVAPADFDLDGDPDLHLAGGARDALSRTDLGGGRWLHVRLAGSRSHRAGVGARIRVTAGGHTQTRFVTADQPIALTPFGLGGATIVDAVEVTWPSGAVSRVANVPVFSRITITEVFTPPSRLALGRVYPNPSNDATRIELLVPANGADVELRVHDLAGRQVWSRREPGLASGIRTVTWDGRDADGREVPAGVYFLRATYAGGAASARIVHLR